MMHLTISPEHEYKKVIKKMVQMLHEFSANLNEITIDNEIEPDDLRYKMYLYNQQLRNDTLYILKTVWTPELDAIVCNKD
jgi:hypothetical protein